MAASHGPFLSPPRLSCKHKTFPVKTESSAAMDAPPNGQADGLSRRESSAQFLGQEVTSSPEGEETEPSSREWTDEKHSLYLNSMEASFVNQLYDSPGLLGWPPRKWNPKPSSISFGQFKVLRGGLWQKMKFVRGENQRRGDLRSNPWIIRHFRTTTRRGRDPGLPFLRERGKQALSCGGATTSKESPLRNPQYCQDSVCSNTEVSDQNFVEDEIEGSRKRVKKPGS